MTKYNVIALEESIIEKLLRASDPVIQTNIFMSIYMGLPKIKGKPAFLRTIDIPKDDKAAPEEIRGQRNIPAICTYEDMGDMLANRDIREVYLFARTSKTA